MWSRARGEAGEPKLTLVEPVWDRSFIYTVVPVEDLKNAAAVSACGQNNREWKVRPLDGKGGRSISVRRTRERESVLQL